MAGHATLPDEPIGIVTLSGREWPLLVAVETAELLVRAMDAGLVMGRFRDLADNLQLVRVAEIDEIEIATPTSRARARTLVRALNDEANDETVPGLY